MRFLEWEYMNFDQYFTDGFSQESNQQYPSIGSDNVLSEAMMVSFQNHDIDIHCVVWKPYQTYQSIYYKQFLVGFELNVQPDWPWMVNHL